MEEGHRDILNSPNFSLPFLDDNLLKGAILWASGANILLVTVAVVKKLLNFGSTYLIDNY